MSSDTTTRIWERWSRQQVPAEVTDAIEKIPFLARIWKGLKNLEGEARRTIVIHAESLAKRPKFEKEIVIVEGLPPIRLKCILFPWLPQCQTDHISRIFPWLCWHCWLCQLPCRYCPPPPPDGCRIDPIMAIDAIMHHLPDLEPSKITEDAVLKASINLMKKKTDLIRTSIDRVTENLKALE